MEDLGRDTVFDNAVQVEDCGSAFAESKRSAISQLGFAVVQAVPSMSLAKVRSVSF